MRFPMSTARAWSRSFAPPSASSVARPVRFERGDDLFDMAEMLDLVLEDPAHDLPRRPSPSHHDVIELGIGRLHHRESLKSHPMDRLQRVVRVCRPFLESRQKGGFGEHHVLERFAY